MLSEVASLDRKYTAQSGRVYVSGIEALVRVPIDVHRSDRRRGLNSGTFISGYPGSPLGGLDLALRAAKGFLSEHEVLHEPAVNEELAATAVWGSQIASTFPDPKYDGVVGIWYGKSPGLDRAGDAIRHGNFAGTDPKGGVLCLVGDDPACKSSSLPCSSEGLLADLGMPILYPGDVQEVIDLAHHGIMLSRLSGFWVGLKMVTDVADGVGTAEVGGERVRLLADHLFREAPGRRVNPAWGSVELEREFYQPDRLEAVLAYARACHLNRITVGAASRSWLGIVASGKTYLDTRHALRQLGFACDEDLERIGVRLLKLGMLHPLDPVMVREFADGLEEVLVVEEKRPFIERALRNCLYGSPYQPLVLGKVSSEGEPLLPGFGELEPDTIARGIHARLARKGLSAGCVELERDLDTPLPASGTVGGVRRTPYPCSGCPHNRSLVLPEDAIVSGGIGCHSMAEIQLNSAALVSGTQMGGEGANWIGIAPFVGTTHIFQDVGDGTFSHSASLAVRAAAASGRNITFKLLYNKAVGMTGGQAVTGQREVEDLTRLLEAEGVKKTIVTTENPRAYRRAELANNTEVWHRDRLLEAHEHLRRIEGATVLLHDQRCAAEARRLRRRGQLPDPTIRVFINDEVCEGCGDCGRKSNCLSVVPVETELGQKRQIEQSSCNKDYSCLLGDCPSFVTVENPEAESTPIPRASSLVIPPEPAIPAGDDYAIYMCGIGGTGVVTVNRIVGMAAHLEGKVVRSLDQTGLAQKGGPVVSNLRILSEAKEMTNRVATGEADLYLAFDLLVGVEDSRLRKAKPDRTLAVVNTSIRQSGAGVRGANTSLPDASELVGVIRHACGGGRVVEIDAGRLAMEMFGDHMMINVIMLGAAYQAGAIPVSGAAIEDALHLNGVAVEENLRAFRLGRTAVQQASSTSAPPLVSREVRRSLRVSKVGAALLRDTKIPRELEEQVAPRASELADYQDPGYARRYVEFVAKSAEKERAACCSSGEIAKAIASSLYKLMAYKDEYEVARLHLKRLGELPKGRRRYWHLHPPLLRAFGLRRKIRLREGLVMPLFRILRAMRKLRGTWIDAFGYSATRRVERRLPAEYQDVMSTALDCLRAETRGRVLQLACAPEMIRGYEDVKTISLEPYHAKIRNELEELRASDETRSCAVARN